MVFLYNVQNFKENQHQKVAYFWIIKGNENAYDKFLTF